MEARKDNERPTFATKTLSGLGYSGIATTITLIPLFIACTFKRTHGEFFDRINELSHHLTIPTFITGLVYGWGRPDQKYMENQSTQLKIENAVLQSKLQEHVPQKSWTDAEQKRTVLIIKTR